MGAIGWIVLGLIASYLASPRKDMCGEAVSRIGGKLVGSQVITRPYSDLSIFQPTQQ